MPLRAKSFISLTHLLSSQWILSLIEIDSHDLTDSVGSIDWRPYVLLAFKRLDYPFQRHRQPRAGRERTYDDDNLGSLSLFGKSYVFKGSLNLSESYFRGPEDFVKRVRRTDVVCYVR